MWVSGVGGGIEGGRLRPAEPLPHRSHQLGEQVVLGREVPVEQALGDARRVADVGDARRRVAALGEQLHRRLDELLLALLALFGVLARGDVTLGCIVGSGHGLSSAGP